MGGFLQSSKEKVEARARICSWCYTYYPYLSTVTPLLWLKADLLALSFSLSLHSLSLPQAFVVVVLVPNFLALYPLPIKQQSLTSFPITGGKG